MSAKTRNNTGILGISDMTHTVTFLGALASCDPKIPGDLKRENVPETLCRVTAKRIYARGQTFDTTGRWLISEKRRMWCAVEKSLDIATLKPR